VRRRALAVCVSALASGLLGLLPSAAPAATIKVDTTAETAVFTPPGPTYYSEVTGDTDPPGKCSLREAVVAANTNAAVNDCAAGDGPKDVIELMPGIYHVKDNLFIAERVVIKGPNAGLPGNDPARDQEATVELDDNPYWQAQPALFWLDVPVFTGRPLGAGTVFNGIELRGAFDPDCTASGPGTGECAENAIVEPAHPPPEGAEAPGYVLVDSVVRDFTFGLYLGGTRPVVKNNLFVDNNRNPEQQINAGNDVYADEVWETKNPIVVGNVFANPVTAAVNLEGDVTKEKVEGGVIAHNVIRKKPANGGYGVFLISTRGQKIADNVIFNPKPVALKERRDAGISLDRVDHVRITGNTLVGLGSGINAHDSGIPFPQTGVTDVRAANNRIYGNAHGIGVRLPYGPLSIDATENWWGANGGAGSSGARSGAANPVNDLYFEENGGQAPNPGGIEVGQPLQLTCSAPSTVEVGVPAPVVGRVHGMPTVDLDASRSPFFVDYSEPKMDASASPGLGELLGFGLVPSQGAAAGKVLPGAALAGALVARQVGSGRVSVELDSEKADCPVKAVPGPEVEVEKQADSPTASPGGLAGFRIVVRNTGKVVARRLRACDLLPRQMSFVRADRRLSRVGRKRCMSIRRLQPGHQETLHITLRVAADAPPGPVQNTAVVEVAGPPGPTAEKKTFRAPLTKGGTKVRVGRHREGRAPVVTG
jgi:uncharacterized repeat protein (TIGR01451 family)